MAASTAASQDRKGSAYPPPLVVAPSSSHKYSFIILHGRGSNAEMFSRALLKHSIPSLSDLKSAFPNARLVFPTASKRRATVFNRSAINQWFDMWHLKESDRREELQINGLRESRDLIHGLLREEIKVVGAENVVLWGLSQGCAASLVATLTWEGEPFTATVGMCGWLPFRKRMEDVIQGAGLQGDEDENPFAGEDETVGEEVLKLHDGQDSTSAETSDPMVQAVEYLRGQLDVPAVDKSCCLAVKKIPLFIGHGGEDVKVPTQLGREAAGCLGVLGMAVEWHEYEALGHWYSEAMLKDIVLFLKARLKATNLGAEA